jgi:hypothetical protein
LLLAVALAAGWFLVFVVLAVVLEDIDPQVKQLFH